MKLQPVAMILLGGMAAQGMAQTIYKCPKPDGTTMIQQMPCSAQGGGETMTVAPIKASGADSAEATARMKAYSESLNKEWDKQAEIDKAESDRRAALAAEHRKARAAEEQAAAQRATAAAIRATGQRY